ncbi:MAG: formylglycine-generating enzyme family protein [Myxococcales bacterium]|nr:formylglycine-generating enzyme family protein [Myxococcales bacterium]
MSESPSRFRIGVPEVAIVASLAGLAWWLWPEAVVVPDTRWQCGHPDNAQLDMCFVEIPGGTFTMGVQATDPDAPGHDPDAEPHEGPPHRVDLGAYWITETEVIVGAYRMCVEAGGCSEDEVSTAGGFSTYYPVAEAFDPQQDTMPVNSVSWQGAADFCAWIGGRLPTEAEWEFAARGPEARRWPWGSEPHCAVPNSDDPFHRLRDAFVDHCAQDGPVRARALPNKSPFGVIGMAGNLWEWTADWYADDAYTQHSRRDPTGPSSGDRRAQRGGGWTTTTPTEIRATVRGGLAPDAQLNDVGFRCVIGGVHG